MTKLLAIIMAVLLATFLVACKNSSKATIYNDKSEVLKVVDDSTTMAEIVDAWRVKERSLEKLMPLFEYKIEMDLDGEKQVWHFNKGGYLMKEGESMVYRTSKKQVFSSLIQ